MNGLSRGLLTSAQIERVAERSAGEANEFITVDRT